MLTQVRFSEIYHLFSFFPQELLIAESRQLKEEMYDRIQDLHIPEFMITREEQGKVDEAALKRLRKKMEVGVSDNDEASPVPVPAQ